MTTSIQSCGFKRSGDQVLAAIERRVSSPPPPHPSSVPGPSQSALALAQGGVGQDLPVHGHELVSWNDAACKKSRSELPNRFIYRHAQQRDESSCLTQSPALIPNYHGDVKRHVRPT